MKEKSKYSSEFEFISDLKKTQTLSRKTIVGIGDDCAILPNPSSKNFFLLTTDLLTEGVHFEVPWTVPKALGMKSVSINVSDIAAMGGVPTHLLCSIAIPSKHRRILDELMAGVQKQSQKYRIDLIGGDTNLSQNDLSICITVMGETMGQSVIRRDGAKNGDLIFCSGKIGDHGLGLQILKAKKKLSQLSKPEKEDLMHQFLNPDARLDLGLQLAELGNVSSMIDVSDGLIQDLRHLLRASLKSAILNPEQIPLSEVFRKTDLSWKEACSFGEDYELLFTAPPSLKEKILALSTKNCPLSCVGEIIENKTGEAQILDPKMQLISFEKEGHQHF